MNGYKLDANKLKQIPITDFLNKLNHKPTSQKGCDWWYLSPFRNEKTPSFKVDIEKNFWYDFGGGQEGGDIIRLVENLYNMTFKEALNELARLTNHNEEKTPQTLKKHTYNQQIKSKVQEKAEIKNIQPLQNQILIDYLKSREINIDIAKEYLKEIYYINNNKSYFANGFENDSGGYELRSKYFQGGLKGYPKDITTLKMHVSKNIL